MLDHCFAFISTFTSNNVGCKIQLCSIVWPGLYWFNHCFGSVIHTVSHCILDGTSYTDSNELPSWQCQFLFYNPIEPACYIRTQCDLQFRPHSDTFCNLTVTTCLFQFWLLLLLFVWPDPGPDSSRCPQSFDSLTLLLLDTARSNKIWGARVSVIFFFFFCTELALNLGFNLE